MFGGIVESTLKKYVNNSDLTTLGGNIQISYNCMQVKKNLEVLQNYPAAGSILIFAILKVDKFACFIEKKSL